MKSLLLAVTIVASTATLSQVQAAGCLSGAAVGGVAGHFAGHHGVLGAVAGCAIGHHQANKQKRANERNTPADQPQNAQ